MWVDALGLEGRLDALGAFLGKFLMFFGGFGFCGAGVSSDTELDLGVVAHGVGEVLEDVSVLRGDLCALRGEMDTLVDVDLVVVDGNASPAPPRATTDHASAGDGLFVVCAGHGFVGGFSVTFHFFLFRCRILSGGEGDGVFVGAFAFLLAWDFHGFGCRVDGLGGLDRFGLGDRLRRYDGGGLGSHHRGGGHRHHGGACGLSKAVGHRAHSAESVSAFGHGCGERVDDERRERALCGEEGWLLDGCPREGTPAVSRHHKVKGVRCFFLFGVEIKVGFVDLARELGSEEALREKVRFVVIGKVEDGVVDHGCAKDGVGDGFSVGIGNAQGGGGGGAERIGGLVGLDADVEVFAVPSEDQAFGDRRIFVVKSGQAKDAAPLFFKG